MEKKEITDIEYEEILQFKNCEYKINIQNGISCFPKTDGIYKNVQKVKPVKYGKTNEYCFAEELANIMGVEVEAPNKKLYMYPNGNTKIGRQNEGEMIIYKPNDRRRLK